MGNSRCTRIFIPNALAAGDNLELEQDSAHHLVNVLRLKSGAVIRAFNGMGGEFECEITEIGKRRTSIGVIRFLPVEAESNLEITLIQGISRAERMDYCIQKSVELGVTRIIPLATERTQFRLRGEKATRKQLHWQRVAISACEQCGRNRIPKIDGITDLKKLTLESDNNLLKLMLDPLAGIRLKEIKTHAGVSYAVLIGAEGGFSPIEIDQVRELGFQGVRLGPRVLRTESAGPAAVAAIQTLWGDLG